MKVGRYTMLAEFASGGMASIHFGRLSGEAGFSRVVAIKRMHKMFAKDSELVKMFMDEARVSGSVQHPNVVAVLDVVREDGELFLVMDYVHGEPLSKLIKLVRARKEKVPPPIAARIAADMLYGLHAAHEAKDGAGRPLEIVHRDVSPQNLLVGMDGVSRVVDFGVAKAEGRLQATAEGNLKGKLGYFSPEQLKQEVDRRTDVFAAAIVLWETLSAKRLFVGDSHWDVVHEVLHKEIEPPSKLDPPVPEALSEVVMRGLARDKEARFQTARDMAQAVERAIVIASAAEVAEWVQRIAGDELDKKRALLAAADDVADLLPPPSQSRPPSPAAPARVERSGASASKPDPGADEDGSSEPAPSLTSPDAERSRGRSAAAEIGAPDPSSRSSGRLVAAVGVMVGVAGVAFAVGRGLQGAAPTPTPTSTAGAPDATAPTEAIALVATATAAPVESAPAPLRSLASATGVAPTLHRLAPTAPRASATLAVSQPPFSEEPVIGRRCFGISHFNGAWCADRNATGGVGCFDLSRNRNHCGTCETQCSDKEWCRDGKCGPPSCSNGLTACGEVCIDTRISLGNCGGCNKLCRKRICDNGECED